MEEKKIISNTNINSLRQLASGELDDFSLKVKGVKKGVSDISKTLTEREQAIKVARKEEETRLKQEEIAVKSKQEEEAKKPVEVVEKTPSVSADEKSTAKENKAEANNIVEDKTVKQEKSNSDTQKVEVAQKVENTEKAEKVEKTQEPQKTVTVEVNKEEKVEEKPAISEQKEQAPIRQPQQREQTQQNEQRRNNYNNRDGQDNRRNDNRSDNQRKEFVPREDRPRRDGQRPQGGYNNQNGGQGGYNGQRQGGYQGNNPRPQGGYNNQNGGQGGYNGQRQGGYQGNNPRPQGGQGNNTRPQGAHTQAGFGGSRPSKPQEVTFIPRNTKQNNIKKKVADKNIEEKHVINKKQLAKTNVTVADFDEEKTGYRKLRVKKATKAQNEQRIVIDHAYINKELIPLKELSEKIGVSAVEITKMLFKEGIIKTINDSIDFDTAAYVASNLNIVLELKLDKTAEDVLSEGYSDEADDSNELVARPPIVTVMGHVDHGKTSLLDRIRKTNVTAGEAGGITQHIGAYSVNLHGHSITFLDTPGHAAFTAMRARGAQVTDIAVIVIAADDGIMPQTVEAINHAKAAEVSIIIAANKMDKPQANLDKVRQQLSEQNILVEDWGGDILLVPVSAKTGEGVEDLLTSILTIAEMRELKANPNRKAKGAIIEARLDKGRGPVATVVVQNGTLRTGDNIVAGTCVGKVRAMFDDAGNQVKVAGPSTAVSILGLETVPNAGDVIFAVDQEKLSKLVAEERKNKEREDMIRQSQKVTLDELFSQISDGNLKTLNLIIKADVQGSVEAVKQSLEELSNDEVKIRVLHSAVGAINETDVMLADSSNSIIIGFNVRADANGKQLAEQNHVDIKLYRIIYEAIDDVKKAMKGMLAPKFNDVYMGKAEVRNTFNITGVGMVAGCYVTDGKIVRSGKLRIYRNDVMICEGNVKQLKRFKDDVKEVAAGYECGISIEDFTDVKVGDFIESYVVEEQE